MSAIVIKTPEQIEGIRKSAKLAAETLKYLEQFVVSGMKTIDIDKKCEEFVRDNGAVPATKGYRGFKHSCCISPYEVICHGVPNQTILVHGDIVNIDKGHRGGYHLTSFVDHFVVEQGNVEVWLFNHENLSSL